MAGAFRPLASEPALQLRPPDAPRREGPHPDDRDRPRLAPAPHPRREPPRHRQGRPDARERPRSRARLGLVRFHLHRGPRPDHWTPSGPGRDTAWGSTSTVTSSAGSTRRGTASIPTRCTRSPRSPPPSPACRHDHAPVPAGEGARFPAAFRAILYTAGAPDPDAAAAREVVRSPRPARTPSRSSGDPREPRPRLGAPGTVLAHTDHGVAAARELPSASSSSRTACS